MNAAWTTDLHFDHAHPREREEFLRELARCGADALLISGDLATANLLLESLARLGGAFPGSIYYVLGNHDYYGASIAGVRRAVVQVPRQLPHVRWLAAEDVVPLSERTGLVGHDGWGDGRCGRYATSTVQMTDFWVIRELTGLSHRTRGARLAALGDEAAAHLRRVLPGALDRFERVIVLTHVPPFPEACLYEGQPTDDNWLPHFCCGAVGDVLVAAMQARPDHEMVVLCGHTHHRAEVRPLPNLHVKVGAAAYGYPRIQEMIELL